MEREKRWRTRLEEGGRREKNRKSEKEKVEGSLA